MAEKKKTVSKKQPGKKSPVVASKGGIKTIKIENEEMLKQLQDEKKLVGYVPKTGLAKVKE